MSPIPPDRVMVRPLSPAVALALVMLGAATTIGACGKSTFPPFTGANGKDASRLDQGESDPGAVGSGGTTPSGTGSGSSGGGGGDAGVTGTGGQAPATGGTSSGGRSGGTGGAATGSGGAASTGATGTGGTGGAGPLVTVTVSIVGGPAGASITPTSPTAGSSCIPGSCKVPVGGSVTATAPTLTDWDFYNWTGEAVVSTPTYQLRDLVRDVALTAHYINQRMESCLDSPPLNAATTSTTPVVTTTYSTARGWSTPAKCPWMCLTGFCTDGTNCWDPGVDALALTSGANGYAPYGGDDGPSSVRRSLGLGQSVTPSTTITMTRFGFFVRTKFAHESNGEPPAQPVILELDRRDANGTIQATYSTMVPPGFAGGWVYWDTPATVLSPGVVYVFTTFVTNAFTQAVDSSLFVSEGGYAPGSAYTATVTSGDLREWSLWTTIGPGDLLFRIQQRNSVCK